MAMEPWRGCEQLSFFFCCPEAMDLNSIIQRSKNRSVYKAVRFKIAGALILGCFVGAECMYRYLDPEGVRFVVQLALRNFNDNPSGLLMLLDTIPITKLAHTFG
jgi:hypothetical protein